MSLGPHATHRSEESQPENQLTAPAPYPSLQEHVSEVGHSLFQGQENLGGLRPWASLLWLCLLWPWTPTAFGPWGQKMRKVKLGRETPRGFTASGKIFLRKQILLGRQA